MDEEFELYGILHNYFKYEICEIIVDYIYYSKVNSAIIREEYELAMSLIESGELCDIEQAVLYAASDGHVEFVKHFIEKEHIIDKYYILQSACANGHFDIVKYLFDKCKVDPNAIACAAESGHLEIIKYLFENGISINLVAIDLAEKNFHYSTQKYLSFHYYNEILEEFIISDISTLILENF